MGKTLVVAEKPSVGRDLRARCLAPSSRARTRPTCGASELRDQLGGRTPRRPRRARRVRPKLKKWRFADLPILPDKFKLVPNDDKAEKQLNGRPPADEAR